jgi:hypothetical protein
MPRLGLPRILLRNVKAFGSGSIDVAKRKREMEDAE